MYRRLPVRASPAAQPLEDSLLFFVERGEKNEKFKKRLSLEFKFEFSLISHKRNVHFGISTKMTAGRCMYSNVCRVDS